MLINVAKIRKTFGASQTYELKASQEKTALEDTEMGLNKPLLVSVKATNLGNSILLTGSVSTEATLTCSRCLETFPLSVDADFAEEICHESNEQAYLSEHPEAKEEQDYTLFSAEEVDIAAIVLEQVILSLPMKPLCSEECSGLCPKCGCNLNKSECGCNVETLDPRLAGLAKFLTD